MIYFKKYFLIVFFLLFSGILGGITYTNTIDKKQDAQEIKFNNIIEKDLSLKEKNGNKEQMYSENFANKLFFVEKYGLLQKMMGKKIVDDAVYYRRVYKGNEDMLYYIIPKKDINEMAVENITKLRDDLDKNDIKVSFVMPPNKHSIASENFPYGLLDYTTTNSDDLNKKLLEKGISVLNLNKLYFEENMDDEKSFYKTDTHWKNETAFWGYQKTIDFLSNTYGYEVENINKSNNISNYSITKYENTYIGSMGKRVGVDYIPKKDDYSLIIPSFDTNYKYEKYDENYKMVANKQGSFEDVFINKNILSDEDKYIDKYTTMMGYGYPYEVITNENIKNNSKIVLIKDSFAMPYSSYLSTNIQKIYMFDTRYDNIRATLRDKIKNINPDMVIFVCSPSSIFYFENMFNF